MTKSLLVLGAGGYLGRHLIPVLVTQGGFRITAVSSQANVVAAFRDVCHLVHPVCLPLEEFPLEQAREHDVVVNLACAGVAHKDDNAIHSLSTNLSIAHRICQLAVHSRDRLLLHFGSDTEQSQLAVYLNSYQGMSLPAAMVQSEASLYSLSKVIQSSVIRYCSSKSDFYAHVIMTPNLYGGQDPPRSLVGAMRAALQAGLPFALRNPTAVKRFIHVNSFSAYVIALLHDLLTRSDFVEGRQRFEVSSADFVPRTTVAAFAQRQWKLLGGDLEALLLDGP
jgi:nucleoside-diphosphate-sugar epimerase